MMSFGCFRSKREMKDEKKRSDDDDEDIFKSCETADDRLTSNQGEGEDRERQQGKKGERRHHRQRSLRTPPDDASVSMIR